MPKPKHDWSKEQPHDPKTGKFVREKTAENNPAKYTWVKENPPKRNHR